MAPLLLAISHTFVPEIPDLQKYIVDEVDQYLAPHTPVVKPRELEPPEVVRDVHLLDDLDLRVPAVPLFPTLD